MFMCSWLHELYGSPLLEAVDKLPGAVGNLKTLFAHKWAVPNLFEVVLFDSSTRLW